MSQIKKTRCIKMVMMAMGAIFLGPATALAADPKIDLDIISTGGGSKLQFTSSACPSDPGFMGCVNVAKGSKNWINWELSNEASRDGWVLTRLQLNLDDPELTDCIVRDFNVDPNTGVANDFRVQGNGKYGRNWVPGVCAQQQYWRRSQFRPDHQERWAELSRTHARSRQTGSVSQRWGHRAPGPRC